MATVKEIYQALDDWAPFETQMSFDNAGLLVGRQDQKVTGILVALDVTLPVVEEAAACGANLIVAHHPVIFDPVRSVSDATLTGALLLTMAERGIAAICAHTNLDAAQGGVNDCLAQALELEEIGLLTQDGTDRKGRAYGIGRTGLASAQETAPSAYAAFVKKKLGAASIRFVDGGKPVRRVAVGGGSCGSMLEDAVKAGCDTFVTADVKYNVFLDAKAMGLNLMDAGHYATENVVCPALVRFCREKFPEIPVSLSACHREVYQEA
jgi:dinuclear metal center YbgI/SA1388 family protein